MGGCQGEKQGDGQPEEGGLAATRSGFCTGHVVTECIPGPSHMLGAGRVGGGPGRGRSVLCPSRGM